MRLVRKNNEVSVWERKLHQQNVMDLAAEGRYCQREKQFVGKLKEKLVLSSK